MSKKIKSKYRSENSIYRIFTGYVRTEKNQPQRHFQTKYVGRQVTTWLGDWGKSELGRRKENLRLGYLVTPP